METREHLKSTATSQSCRLAFSKMAVSDRKVLKIRVVPSIVLAAVVAGLVFWLVYMGRPAPPSTAMQPPTPAEKAYAPNIAFSGVTMQAAENLMQQRVVEIRGRIVNHGQRTLSSISVDCFFTGIRGEQIYNERKIAFASKTHPLKPGESRPFRLAFDHLPDSWNQASPRFVVARIAFASKT